MLHQVGNEEQLSCSLHLFPLPVKLDQGLGNLQMWLNSKSLSGMMQSGVQHHTDDHSSSIPDAGSTEQDEPVVRFCIKQLPAF